MMSLQEAMRRAPKGRKRHRRPPLKRFQTWTCILLRRLQTLSLATYLTLLSLKRKQRPWRMVIHLVRRPKLHSRLSRLLQRSHRNFVLVLPLKATPTLHHPPNLHLIPPLPRRLSPMYPHYPYQSHLLSRVSRHPRHRLRPPQPPFQKLAQAPNCIQQRRFPKTRSNQPYFSRLRPYHHSCST